MEWFKNWFNKDYLLLYPNRDELEARIFVDFLKQYFEEKKFRINSVIDLGCGTGRHLKYLSQLYNNSTGLDYSAELLGIAKEELKATKANLLRADKRALPFKNSSFDLICSFFTSFGYLEKDEDNQKVLSEIRRIAKDNSYFVLDFLNIKRKYEIDTSLKTRKVDNIIIEEYKQFSDDKKRILKKIKIIEKNQKREYLESVRLFSKEELVKMLNKASYEVVDIFGDYEGNDYKKESPRLILISKAS